MEHSIEPTLPKPLPRPLSDPLRRYRWLLVFSLPLLAVAVLAVAVGLLLPDVRKVREAAARTPNRNNLKQMAAAIHRVQPNDVLPDHINAQNNQKRIALASTEPFAAARM